MKKKRIIFLDVDGVLNSEKSFYYHKERGNNPNLYDAPHEPHVKALAHIINETGAELVFSSSWRGSWRTSHFAMVLSMLCPQVNFQFVGKTPRFVGEHRGYEIKWWLDLVQTNEVDSKVIQKAKSEYMGASFDFRENRNEPYLYEIESFVVLDDDDDMDGLESNFVHVNNKEGLTMADAEKAIKILNMKT